MLKTHSINNITSW